MQSQLYVEKKKNSLPVTMQHKFVSLDNLIDKNPLSQADWQVAASIYGNDVIFVFIKVRIPMKVKANFTE